jgi:hypothetical protein
MWRRGWARRKRALLHENVASPLSLLFSCCLADGPFNWIFLQACGRESFQVQEQLKWIRWLWFLSPGAEGQVDDCQSRCFYLMPSSLCYLFSHLNISSSCSLRVISLPPDLSHWISLEGDEFCFDCIEFTDPLLVIYVGRRSVFKCEEDSGKFNPCLWRIYAQSGRMLLKLKAKCRNQSKRNSQ